MVLDHMLNLNLVIQDVFSVFEISNESILLLHVFLISFVVHFFILSLVVLLYRLVYVYLVLVTDTLQIIFIIFAEKLAIRGTFIQIDFSPFTIFNTNQSIINFSNLLSWFQNLLLLDFLVFIYYPLVLDYGVWKVGHVELTFLFWLCDHPITLKFWVLLHRRLPFNHSCSF